MNLDQILEMLVYSQRLQTDCKRNQSSDSTGVFQLKKKRKKVFYYESFALKVFSAHLS